jgi:hypothetical protein
VAEIRGDGAGGCGDVSRETTISCAACIISTARLHHRADEHVRRGAAKLRHRA